MNLELIIGLVLIVVIVNFVFSTNESFWNIHPLHFGLPFTHKYHYTPNNDLLYINKEHYYKDSDYYDNHFRDMYFAPYMFYPSDWMYYYPGYKKVTVSKKLST